MVVAQIASTRSFVAAAARYWLSVFPRIRRDARALRARALRIPDPVLRGYALEAQRVKRGNVDGSAAFSVCAPRAHRAFAVRAQVAFQSAYDYVDTLAEQPHENPIVNGCQLHQALLVALDGSASHPDYYAYFSRRRDAGYLAEMVDACRYALQALPSRASIAAPARRASERIVAYQSLNLSEQQGGHAQLRRWALQATPVGTGLKWWETAASAGSSLGLFALIAAAAKPSLAAAEPFAIEDAYWPWVGALHSLLDSLVDLPEDKAAGQRSLLDYYDSHQELAARLQMLATEALRALRTLSDAPVHTLILGGMVSFYLTAPEASSDPANLAAESVLETLGTIAKPSMHVLRARRAASQIHAKARDRAAGLASCLRGRLS